jgi:hypothetical protein
MDISNENQNKKKGLGRGVNSLFSNSADTPEYSKPAQETKQTQK